MILRFFVAGEVQGVGFRWFVVRRAQALGLTGYTRNLADGRVEVLAQGSPGELDRLEGELRRGPGRARVEAVEKWEILDEGAGYKSFEII
jgi:acylphosphatase